MRDKMERLVVLPFAAGCISTSSIAVYERQPQSGTQRPKHHSHANSFPSIGVEEQEDTLSSENMRSSYRFLSTLPKPNISTGFQRFAKSLKTVSQFFVFREEMQEVEMDMEIGAPTDVKHVTHIGIDGYATTNSSTLAADHDSCCDDNLKINPSEFLSPRPISSTHEFELAMSVQDEAPLIHLS